MALGMIGFGKSVAEMRKLVFWRDLLSEFLATYSLIYCVTANDFSLEEGGTVDLIDKALNYGFAVLMLVEAFTHLGGGHMNPAISWFYVLTKKISLIKGK